MLQKMLDILETPGILYTSNEAKHRKVKVKICETYGMSVLNNDSTVYVVDGNTEYQVSNKNWTVEVAAPDGHFYPLKSNWEISDLIHFIEMFPFEDPDLECQLIFTYSSSDESFAFTPIGYSVFLTDGVYDVYFI